MTAHGGHQRESICAIVVAYHSGPDLLRCCRSLLSSEAVECLIVIDNGAETGTVDPEIAAVVALRDPRLCMMTTERNLGFGAAINQALRRYQQAASASRSHAPWLLLVNPDCEVEPALVSALLSRAQHQPDLGAASVRLTDAMGVVDPNSMRFDLSIARLAAQALRLPSAWGLGLYAPTRDPWQEVHACSGALMLVRLSAFTAIAGFDPEYFLHFEDLDFCRRLRAAGFTVWVATDLFARHEKGGSSSNRSAVNQHKRAGFERYFDRFLAPSLGRWAPWFKRCLRLAIRRWR